jgi:hypothetical protein
MTNSRIVLTCLGIALSIDIITCNGNYDNLRRRNPEEIYSSIYVKDDVSKSASNTHRQEDHVSRESIKEIDHEFFSAFFSRDLEMSVPTSYPGKIFSRCDFMLMITDTYIVF